MCDSAGSVSETLGAVGVDSDSLSDGSAGYVRVDVWYVY